MKVIIQTPGIAAQQPLLDLVNDKIQKLGEINERLIEARVILRLDNSDTRENKICEIRIGIPGNDLFAGKQAKSFEEALALSVDAMKRQIVEWKKKKRPIAS